MQGMITCVHREHPALLTRGITQFGTIARVLSVSGYCSKEIRIVFPSIACTVGTVG